MMDIYFDNLIAVDIKGLDKATRLERAWLLGLSTVAPEVVDDKPIPCDNMDAGSKLVAVTGLTEQKIILRWFVNYRQMMIALPENKSLAYSKAISKMLQWGWTSHRELDTNIGQLVHLGQIIPFVHHSLGQLHFLMKRAKKKRAIDINEQCQEDLKFLLFVLVICQKGIDLNLIAYTKPMHTYGSDSCPAGVGRYNNQGFTWRFYLS
jgi:hypothetical protein